MDIIEKFGSLDVNIVGTREDPLFNANDILFKVLEYADGYDSKWWNKLKTDPEMV